MGAPPVRDEIFTGWKEISAYLKSSVRSCLRWEAAGALPVHRPQGPSKSRVFAYKNELDAWLRARLANGAIETTPRVRRVLHRPAIFIWLPALAVLFAAGVFLIIRGPESPHAKGVSAGAPESSGPFDLLPGDIIASQWAAAGTMRVWREGQSGSFFEAWHIEPVRHTSLAVGDLDREPDLEAVAPGHCREERELEGQKLVQIRFFLNAYKIDHKNWWKTTYYDPTQCVWEKENYSFTEIAVSDIDGYPGNEIVLATAHSLSVFRYDPSLGEIRLVATQTSFLEDAQALFRSVVIGDIDNDGASEILATANEITGGEEAADKGWLMILKWKDEGFGLSQLIPLNGTTSQHSLRIGNVVPGGEKEVVFPLYRTNGGNQRAFLVIWRNNDGLIYDRVLDGPGSRPGGAVFLDVGDLMTESEGDEIVLAREDPNELATYFWDGFRMSAGPKYPVDHRVHMGGIRIRGPSLKPAKPAAVLVHGAADIKDQAGRTYLELLRFTNGFFSEWLRMGGAKGDLPVTYAAVASSPQK